MLTLTIASLTANVLAILGVAIFIKNRGGLSYVMIRMGLRPTRVQAQTTSNWYKETVAQFELIPRSSFDIVFVGDSLTEQGRWGEFFQDYPIRNRGIGGDATLDVLKRLDDIVKGSPAKIFIMVGLNDLAKLGLPVSTISENYTRLLLAMKAASPTSTVFVQSVLPVGDAFRLKAIKKLNDELRNIALENSCEWIDLYSLYAEEGAELDVKYTWDGLHLTALAYLKWMDAVRPFVVTPNFRAKPTSPQTFSS